MRVRIGFPVIVVVGVTLAMTGSLASARPRVVTLVRGGTIESFAQDGNRIVWADTSQRSCRDLVRLRDLTTGKTTPLAAGAPTLCQVVREAGGFQHRMALAGTRALWAYVTASNLAYHFDLFTSAPGQSARPVVSMAIEGGGEDTTGGYFAPVPLAGDGATLVFVNQSNAEENYGSNAVWQVPGGRVPASCATWSIAADRGSFATARYVPKGFTQTEVTALSPDRRRIAYTSIAGGCYDPGSSQLSVAGLDGGTRPIATGSWSASWAPDSVRLLIRDNDESHAGRVEIVDTTTGAHSIVTAQSSGAAWSPDGSRVWIERRPNTGQAFPDVTVISLGDGVAHPLPSVVLHSWSPDGRHLAYATTTGLYVGDANGQAARRIGETISQVEWTLDSTSLVVSRDSGLFLVAADGGGERRLAGKVSGYGLSPDGGHLWYAYQTADGSPFITRVLNLENESGTTLTNETGYFAPVWSSDSRRLAFFVQDAFDGDTAWGRWMLLDVKSGATTTIAHDASSDLSWSPDSSQLLTYLQSRGLTVVDASTGAAVTLPLPAHSTLDGWLPDSRSLLIERGAVDQNGAVDYTDVVEIGRDGAGLRTILPLPRQATPAFTGIEIRRTSDDSVLHSFPTRTLPISLGLSGGQVALLFPGTIELRNTSGVTKRTFTVDKRVTEISMSGRWIVFRAGTSIEALDTNTGATRTIATAIGAVVGLSVDGRRVAWAEQLAGPDTIRAAELP